MGRLLEIRADAGYRTAGDVDVLFDMIKQQLETLPPDTQHVTVVDWRCCPLMSPEASQRIASRMSGTNARTERSAALASQGTAMAVMQFLRVIREAGLPNRKLFLDQAELIDWLTEVLSPSETQRLGVFLNEGH